MAFNLENFNQFQDSVDQIQSNLDQDLSRLATRIVDQMRRDAPVAQMDGGSLRDSIKVNIDRFKFIIEMLKYGPYQNYGVEGTENRAIVTEDEITGQTHKFGTRFSMTGGQLPFGARVNIHRYGISRQPFYDIEDILEQMETIIEESIIETI